MKSNPNSSFNKVLKNKYFLITTGAIFLLSVLFFMGVNFIFSKNLSYEKINEITEISLPKVEPLDTVAYDLKLEELANNPPVKIVEPKIDPETGQVIPEPEPKPNLWPVKAVYPNGGAILPFSRIIAYYGNLYSTKMGVLGEYPEDEMLQKLNDEVKKWSEADPETPALPALHYIAVTAQASKGEDGKYRFRMPDSEIDKVLRMAEKINAIVFLDIQVGLSNLETEIPLLKKYLSMPQVHLGIDPEFSMKTGARPGTVVGTYDAEDINFAANYLATLVKENNLTPKILVVHRYTQKMVTNYQNIRPLPEVQIVMDMDGWGGQAKKKNTYQQFIYKEPVQFTGFKLFYKNDIKEKNTILMTPEEVLMLRPRPIYIQYQ
ncbi:hypothetical protein KKA39_01730 [Patescibacteria group bacterium]|nr:hypothetical protein [Patescibacteria group bacterium]MBU1728004.1 hypothetical protein [Patescibacteria group bacterium]